MNRYQKIAYVVAAALATASLVVPGVNLVTLPVAGTITLGKVIGAAALFLSGWAKTAPGHGDLVKNAIVAANEEITKPEVTNTVKGGQ
jgi:hypothetical protein